MHKYPRQVINELQYDGGLDFKISNHTYGDLSFIETKGDSISTVEEIFGAFVYADWTGHSDNLHAIKYNLQNNVMVATNIWIHNCDDDERQQVGLKFLDGR